MRQAPEPALEIEGLRGRVRDESNPVGKSAEHPEEIHRPMETPPSRPARAARNESDELERVAQAVWLGEQDRLSGEAFAIPEWNRRPVSQPRPHLPDAGLEIGPAAGELPLQQLQAGPSLERLGIAGPERDRRVVVGARRLESTEVLQDHATVADRLRIFRIDVDRALEAGQGLRHPSQVVHGVAAIVPRLGEIRLERDRALIAAERLLAGACPDAVRCPGC